jgi:hypothetical protein
MAVTAQAGVDVIIRTRHGQLVTCMCKEMKIYYALMKVCWCFGDIIIRSGHRQLITYGVTRVL